MQCVFLKIGGIGWTLSLGNCLTDACEYL